MPATGASPGVKTPSATPPDLPPVRRRGLVVGLLLCVAALIVLICLSLAIGARQMPFDDVWHAVVSPSGTENDAVVRQLRMPRTALAILVGAAMALAGALMQALSRNPLADPGLLGVNFGAGLGVVLAIGVFGVRSLEGYVWFSLAGAAVATFAVYALGSVGRAGASPVRLILAGAAIGAVTAGVTSAIVLTDLSVFNGIRSWSVGALAGRDVNVLWQVAPFLIVGIVIGMSLAGSLNALGLGDETAAALGAKVQRIRIAGVVAVTLLCGAGTAAVGPIAFVGLVVPHLARTFTGPNYRWLLPYSLVLGPVLFLAADVAGRVLVRPSELEVAVVLSAIGAPIFIYIARRPRLSEL